MVYNEGRFSSSGMCQIHFTFNKHKTFPKNICSGFTFEKYLFFKNILSLQELQTTKDSGLSSKTFFPNYLSLGMIWVYSRLLSFSSGLSLFTTELC